MLLSAPVEPRLTQTTAYVPFSQTAATRGPRGIAVEKDLIFTISPRIVT